MAKKLWGILLVCLLLMGVWLGVNLWPREMEVPLFTSKDLAIPADETAGANAYDTLQQMKSELEQIADLGEVPGGGNGSEALKSLLQPKFFASWSQAKVFWENLSPLSPSLSTYLRPYQAVWNQYREVLRATRLIDQDDPSDLAKPNTLWVSYVKLHQLGVLEIIEQALQGNIDQAYGHWLQLFRLDISHGRSARTMISHKVAAKNLSQDLKLLSLLRVVPPSAQVQQEVEQSLRAFDPNQLLSMRILISEYLLTLAAGDTLVSEQEAHRGIIQWVYNPALYRKEINAYFRELQKFIANPLQLNEQKVKQFQEKTQSDLSLGPFWWFYNPAGKLLRQIVSADLVSYIYQFEAEKRQLAKMRDDLLQPPLFGETSLVN